MQIHGNEYTMVKDRVAAAHADEGFAMMNEESFEMGGRSYVRITIQVKGKQFIGTAEVKFGANPKTPDGQSPYECGETSALGRALGFAGYGIVESVASADEVMSNVTALTATPAMATSTSTKPAQAKAKQEPAPNLAATNEAKIRALLKEYQTLCPEECTNKNWHFKVRRAAFRIPEGPLPVNDAYTPEHVVALAQFVQSHRKQDAVPV